MLTVGYVLDLTGCKFSNFITKLMLETKQINVDINYPSGRASDVPDDFLPGPLQAIVDGDITMLFSPFDFSELIIGQETNDQRLNLERRLVELFPDCFLLRTMSVFFDDFAVHHGPLWYFDAHLIELFYHRLKEKNPMFWCILNDRPRKSKKSISEKLW